MNLLGRYYAGNAVKAAEYYKRSEGVDTIPVRLINGMDGSVVKVKEYKRIAPSKTRPSKLLCGRYSVSAYFVKHADSRTSSQIYFESTY